ncbi:hypothetical protein [Deefgea sp. CFH1-16]|uniref:hypothetical protein n=1 Tax=Deefgea sp. CFH1-16 TaxID=2675457 RepID=UPI0015F3BD99|nr:hypothetical protein [Deefgea sp. CFH1-16]MBM5575796.1 hypothetical protein [Deefgea sp. CFH1-16]
MIDDYIKRFTAIDPIGKYAVEVKADYNCANFYEDKPGEVKFCPLNANVLIKYQFPENGELVDKSKDVVFEVYPKFCLICGEKLEIEDEDED